MEASAKSIVAPEQDTFTWLLATSDGCPACGRPVNIDAPHCSSCGKGLTVLVRPEARSTAVMSLAGLWGIIAAGAALLAIGATLEAIGMVPRETSTEQSQILRSLARLAGIQSFDQPVTTAPTPTWFLPVMLGLVVGGGTMAGVTWARRPFALYAGIGVALLLAAAGIAVGLRLRGMPALAPVISGLLLASFLILSYLSATPQFLGERRPIGRTPHSSSALGLYREGEAAYQAGLFFLAAQHWARALGKNPGDPALMHALGLALARLGQRERALAQLERAIQVAPHDARIRETYRLIQAS